MSELGNQIIRMVCQLDNQLERAQRLSRETQDEQERRHEYEAHRMRVEAMEDELRGEERAQLPAPPVADVLVEHAEAIRAAKVSYPSRTEVALVALAAEVERLRIDQLSAESCDACGGTGHPVSGDPCMCGGTGRAVDAVSYLRSQLTDARRLVEELTGKLATAVRERNEAWKRVFVAEGFSEPRAVLLAKLDAAGELCKQLERARDEARDGHPWAELVRAVQAWDVAIKSPGADRRKLNECQNRILAAFDRIPPAKLPGEVEP